MFPNVINPIGSFFFGFEPLRVAISSGWGFPPVSDRVPTPAYLERQNQNYAASEHLEQALELARATFRKRVVGRLRHV